MSDTVLAMASDYEIHAQGAEALAEGAGKLMQRMPEGAGVNLEKVQVTAARPIHGSIARTASTSYRTGLRMSS